MECSICLENLQTPIGLQNNCDHIFCFHCLLTWRRTNLNGQCPLCRIRSTFIAPSWRYLTNSNEKQSILHQHEIRLKRIPCRNYFHHGFCSFGVRCYFNHSRKINRYQPY